MSDQQHDAEDWGHDDCSVCEEARAHLPWKISGPGMSHIAVPGLKFNLPLNIKEGVAVYVDGKRYSSMTLPGAPLPPQALRVEPPIDSERPYLVLYRMHGNEGAASTVIVRASSGDSAVGAFRSACGDGHFIEEIRTATSADIFGVEESVAPPSDDNALSMAHACACAVCEYCSMGTYRLVRDEEGGFLHDTGVEQARLITCKASAIHRLIGTKA